MDVVITYVDGNDPVWKADYEKYTNVPVMEKRFRDWGTLRYLLRGIEVNMPFVRNVYLVVSGMTQVPAWVNRNRLKVVLHEQIIPSEYLPTFNSTTIEMFLHRIEGLSEQYIYFNDDTFPLLPSSPEDFFREGKAVTGMSRHLFASSMYKKHVRRSDAIARSASGKSASPFFMRVQHACIPVLKSESENIMKAREKEILACLTRVRTDANLNMTLFLSYMYHKGLVIPERISCRHISLAATSPSKIASYITSPSRTFACINDVQLSEESFIAFRNAITDAFETRFPNKSQFEI